MTPADAIAMHRRQLAQHGQTITLRRRASPVTCTALARMTWDKAEEGAGAVVGRAGTLIVMAQDVAADADWGAGIAVGDQVIVNGRTYGIAHVDAETRRIAGTLIAYVLRVSV